MRTKLLSFVLKLITFTAILFAIQKSVIVYLYNGIPLYYSTWHIYLFHAAVTLLIYFTLTFVHKAASTYTGHAFLGCSFFKMMMVVIFFIPLIKRGSTTLVNDVLAFFIPYFFYLTFEALVSIKLIKLK